MKMKFLPALSLMLILSWGSMSVLSSTLQAHPQHQPRHYRRLPATEIEKNLDRVRVSSIQQPSESKRSLFFARADSCESTVPQPLLIGVVLGIIGTLFIQGFVLLLFRMYHKNQELQNKAKEFYHPHYHLHHPYSHGQIPVPSTPKDFRHLEHMATTQSLHSNSSMSSTAGLLRIAHRRPDGSWAFSEPDSRSDARSEISSISPFATPLHTPSSHRFPPLPSPRGVPSVPYSVSNAPRMSMETINSIPSGYEKSVYSAHTYTHSHTPMPSISRSTHTHSFSTARTSSIHPAQSVSVATSVASPSPSSSGKQQYYIQNLPPSSPPPPMPLPPLPSPGPSSMSFRSEAQTESQVEVELGAQTQTQSSSQRTLDVEVGSTKTGPPPYAAYIPTWREQQEMQNVPPLPIGPNGLLSEKHRRI